jgi:hypothetical protein
LIRRYSVAEIYGSVLTRTMDLCEYHANVKKRFARQVRESGESAPDARCNDCRPTTGPTILDRVIAEAEREERAADPVPVKVLPGQRKLPL